MGLTLAQKILSAHADHEVQVGELVVANIDVCATQDGTGPLAIKEFKKLGKPLHNPKRTILFALWAAEEFGLWGSEHFVKTNENNLDKISNYFNRDGGPLVPYEITVPPAMYSDFASMEQALNSINPDFPFKVKMREGEAPDFPINAGGSDHAPFAKKGVPVFYPRLNDPKGYNFQYREIWHTESDLFNKSIPEYQEHSSIVTAVMLYHLANLDHLLNREGMYKDSGK